MPRIILGERAAVRQSGMKIAFIGAEAGATIPPTLPAPQNSAHRRRFALATPAPTAYNRYRPTVRSPDAFRLARAAAQALVRLSPQAGRVPAPRDRTPGGNPHHGHRPRSASGPPQPDCGSRPPCTPAAASCAGWAFWPWSWPSASAPPCWPMSCACRSSPRPAVRRAHRRPRPPGAAIGLLVFFFGLLLPLNRRVDAAAIAAAVEEKYPELAERLTTSVELADGARRASTAPRTSSKVLIRDAEARPAASTSCRPFRRRRAAHRRRRRRRPPPGRVPRPGAARAVRRPRRTLLPAVG